jgi:hypothetical protein
MKWSFACSIVVPIAAVLSAGCGPRCQSDTFCRWFDLATFCNESGECSIPTGMGLTSTDDDGDRDLLGFVAEPGTFNDLESRTFIAVPISEVSAVLLHEPVLEIWLDGDMPLTFEQVKVTLDGQAVVCGQVERSDLHEGGALACDVPVGSRELRFDYSDAPHAAVPGTRPFKVRMFLHEQEGSCTGSHESCAL